MFICGADRCHSLAHFLSLGLQRLNPQRSRADHELRMRRLPAKFFDMEEDVISPARAKQRKVKGRVEIDIQRCKGCELCTVECKEHALTLSNSINIKGYRYVVADNDRCTGCVNCALVCPDAVITVYRTKVKKAANVVS